MAVLLTSVPLFFFGCSTDAEPGATSYVDSIVGGMTADVLQDFIDDTLAAGHSVTLKNVALSSGGGGIVNLKSARIVGTFTTDSTGASIINARSVTFDTGAKIVAAHNSDTILAKQEDADAGKVAGDVTPLTAYETAVDAANPIGGPTTLVGDLDLSDAAKLADFSAFTATNAHTVYVTGTTTIGVDTGTARIVALGVTNASGGAFTFGANTYLSTLKAGAGLTITAVGAEVQKLDLNGNGVTISNIANIGQITNSGASVAVALGNQTAIPKITVGANDITLTTTGTPLVVAELSTPDEGKLVIPATAVTFTATAGGGNIAYAANPVSATLSSTTGLTFAALTTTGGTLTTSAGALAVTGNLTVTGSYATSIAANLTVGGTAAFGGTFTNSAMATAAFKSLFSIFLTTAL
jgi:filamentous hemagglutinin